MKKLPKLLIDFLFPPFCLSCEQDGAYLCVWCKKDLKPHPESCPWCHRPSPWRRTCLNCFPTHRYIQGVIIAFQYSWVLKKLIWKLKYNHRSVLARFLAERLALFIQTHSELMHAYTKWKLLITYVSSHRRRKYIIKWYNQSELLAKELGKLLNIPCAQLATKTKHTKSQAKLSRKHRLTNLVWVYQNRKSSIKWDEHILIVDDITTTWSTIVELAKTIYSTHPQTKIRWAVIWRHGK